MNTRVVFAVKPPDMFHVDGAWYRDHHQCTADARPGQHNALWDVIPDALWPPELSASARAWDAHGRDTEGTTSAVEAAVVDTLIYSDAHSFLP